MKEHPLPRSLPHDLDARALRARLEDRERVIAAFRERIQEVEQALYWVREESDNRANVIAAQTHNLNVLNEHIKKLEAVAEAAGDLQLHWTARQWNALQRALEALDAKEGG